MKNRSLIDEIFKGFTPSYEGLFYDDRLSDLADQNLYEDFKKRKQNDLLNPYISINSRSRQLTDEQVAARKHAETLIPKVQEQDYTADLASKLGDGSALLFSSADDLGFFNPNLGTTQKFKRLLQPFFKPLTEYRDQMIRIHRDTSGKTIPGKLDRDPSVINFKTDPFYQRVTNTAVGFMEQFLANDYLLDTLTYQNLGKALDISRDPAQLEQLLNVKKTVNGMLAPPSLAEFAALMNLSEDAEIFSNFFQQEGEYNTLLLATIDHRARKGLKTNIKMVLQSPGNAITAGNLEALGMLKAVADYYGTGPSSPVDFELTYTTPGQDYLTVNSRDYKRYLDGGGNPAEFYKSILTRDRIKNMVEPVFSENLLDSPIGSINHAKLLTISKMSDPRKILRAAFGKQNMTPSAAGYINDPFVAASQFNMMTIIDTLLTGNAVEPTLIEQLGIVKDHLSTISSQAQASSLKGADFLEHWTVGLDSALDSVARTARYAAGDFSRSRMLSARGSMKAMTELTDTINARAGTRGVLVVNQFELDPAARDAFGKLSKNIIDLVKAGKLTLITGSNFEMGGEERVAKVRRAFGSDYESLVKSGMIKTSSPQILQHQVALSVFEADNSYLGGVMTSANLTRTGLTKNIELGMTVGKDYETDFLRGLEKLTPESFRFRKPGLANIHSSMISYNVDQMQRVGGDYALNKARTQVGQIVDFFKAGGVSVGGRGLDGIGLEAHAGGFTDKDLMSSPTPEAGLRMRIGLPEFQGMSDLFNVDIAFDPYGNVKFGSYEKVIRPLMIKTNNKSIKIGGRTVGPGSSVLLDSSQSTLLIGQMAQNKLRANISDLERLVANPESGDMDPVERVRLMKWKLARTDKTTSRRFLTQELSNIFRTLAESHLPVSTKTEGRSFYGEGGKYLVYEIDPITGLVAPAELSAERPAIREGSGGTFKSTYHAGKYHLKDVSAETYAIKTPGQEARKGKGAKSDVLGDHFVADGAASIYTLELLDRTFFAKVQNIDVTDATGVVQSVPIVATTAISKGLMQAAQRVRNALSPQAQHDYGMRNAAGDFVSLGEYLVADPSRGKMGRDYAKSEMVKLPVRLAALTYTTLGAGSGDTGEMYDQMLAHRYADITSTYKEGDSNALTIIDKLVNLPAGAELSYDSNTDQITIGDQVVGSAEKAGLRIDNRMFGKGETGRFIIKGITRDYMSGSTVRLNISVIQEDLETTRGMTVKGPQARALRGQGEYALNQMYERATSQRSREILGYTKARQEAILSDRAKYFNPDGSYKLNATGGTQIGQDINSVLRTKTGVYGQVDKLISTGQLKTGEVFLTYGGLLLRGEAEGGLTEFGKTLSAPDALKGVNAYYDFVKANLDKQIGKNLDRETPGIRNEALKKAMGGQNEHWKLLRDFVATGGGTAAASFLEREFSKVRSAYKSNAFAPVDLTDRTNFAMTSAAMIEMFAAVDEQYRAALKKTGALYSPGGVGDDVMRLIHTTVTGTEGSSKAERDRLTQMLRTLGGVLYIPVLIQDAGRANTTEMGSKQKGKLLVQFAKVYEDLANGGTADSVFAGMAGSYSKHGVLQEEQQRILGRLYLVGAELRGLYRPNIAATEDTHLDFTDKIINKETGKIVNRIHKAYDDFIGKEYTTNVQRTKAGDKLVGYVRKHLDLLEDARNRALTGPVQNSEAEMMAERNRSLQGRNQGDLLVSFALVDANTLVPGATANERKGYVYRVDTLQLISSHDLKRIGQSLGESANQYINRLTELNIDMRKVLNTRPKGLTAKLKAITDGADVYYADFTLDELKWMNTVQGMAGEYITQLDTFQKSYEKSLQEVREPGTTNITVDNPNQNINEIAGGSKVLEAVRSPNSEALLQNVIAREGAVSQGVRKEIDNIRNLHVAGTSVESTAPLREAITTLKGEFSQAIVDSRSSVVATRIAGRLSAARTLGEMKFYMGLAGQNTSQLEKRFNNEVVNPGVAKLGGAFKAALDAEVARGKASAEKLGVGRLKTLLMPGVENEITGDKNAESRGLAKGTIYLSTGTKEAFSTIKAILADAKGRKTVGIADFNVQETLDNLHINSVLSGGVLEKKSIWSLLAADQKTDLLALTDVKAKATKVLEVYNETAGHYIKDNNLEKYIALNRSGQPPGTVTQIVRMQSLEDLNNVIRGKFAEGALRTVADSLTATSTVDELMRVGGLNSSQVRSTLDAIIKGPTTLSDKRNTILGSQNLHESTKSEFKNYGYASKTLAVMSTLSAMMGQGDYDGDMFTMFNLSEMSRVDQRLQKLGKRTKSNAVEVDALKKRRSDIETEISAAGSEERFTRASRVFGGLRNANSLSDSILVNKFGMDQFKNLNKLINKVSDTAELEGVLSSAGFDSGLKAVVLAQTDTQKRVELLNTEAYKPAVAALQHAIGSEEISNSVMGFVFPAMVSGEALSSNMLFSSKVATYYMGMLYDTTIGVYNKVQLGNRVTGQLQTEQGRMAINRISFQMSVLGRESIKPRAGKNAADVLLALESMYKDGVYDPSGIDSVIQAQGTLAPIKNYFDFISSRDKSAITNQRATELLFDLTSSLGGHVTSPVGSELDLTKRENVRMAMAVAEDNLKTFESIAKFKGIDTASLPATARRAALADAANSLFGTTRAGTGTSSLSSVTSSDIESLEHLSSRTLNDNYQSISPSSKTVTRDKVQASLTRATMSQQLADTFTFLSAGATGAEVASAILREDSTASSSASNVQSLLTNGIDPIELIAKTTSKEQATILRVGAEKLRRSYQIQGDLKKSLADRNVDIMDIVYRANQVAVRPVKEMDNNPAEYFKYQLEQLQRAHMTGENQQLTRLAEVLREQHADLTKKFAEAGGYIDNDVRSVFDVAGHFESTLADGTSGLVERRLRRKGTSFEIHERDALSKEEFRRVRVTNKEGAARVLAEAHMREYIKSSIMNENDASKNNYLNPADDAVMASGSAVSVADNKARMKSPNTAMQGLLADSFISAAIQGPQGKVASAPTTQNIANQIDIRERILKEAGFDTIPQNDRFRGMMANLDHMDGSKVSPLFRDALLGREGQSKLGMAVGIIGIGAGLIGALPQLIERPDEFGKLAGYMAATMLPTAPTLSKINFGMQMGETVRSMSMIQDDNLRHQAIGGYFVGNLIGQTGAQMLEKTLHPRLTEMFSRSGPVGDNLAGMATSILSQVVGAFAGAISSMALMQNRSQDESPVMSFTAQAVQNAADASMRQKQMEMESAASTGEGDINIYSEDVSIEATAEYAIGNDDYEAQKYYSENDPVIRDSNGNDLMNAASLGF
jgi:hypothetical protein